MSTYLVLKHKCTLRPATMSTNAAGQRVPTYGTDQSLRCEFLYLATDDKVNPVMEMEDIIEVILDDTYEPHYDDLILNIIDRYGNVIESGPLQVIGIRKYAGYSGKLHHFRLRTKRLRNC